MRLRVAPILLSCAVLLPALLSCSSGTTSGGGNVDGGGESGGGSGSSSGGIPPPPDAFVAATVGPGGQATLCPFMTPMTGFVLGAPVGTRPTTVMDGQATSAGSALVSCTVKAQGSGFDILLSASIGNDTIIIQSPTGQGAVQATGGIGLTMNLSDATGVYQGSACTLSYTYLASPIQVSPKVAAGRIWGHLSCPAAQVQGQTGKQCDTEADFLFEQCTQ